MFAKRQDFKHWKQVATDYISRWGSGEVIYYELKNQNASISSAVTIDTPAVSSLRRISAVLKTTSADGTSSTLPKLTLAWTDADSGGSMSQDVTATAATDSTANQSNGTIIVNAKAGVAITFTTSGYLSNTGGKMKYAINVSVEAL